MIEIEKNFDLRDGEKEKLIDGAVFLVGKQFTDVYYDNRDLEPSLKDYWLRTRDSKWELKVPLNPDKEENRKTDQYRELETEREIIEALGFSFESLSDELKQKGFEPLATITTKRESYERDGFHIDFDEADFGYSTCEIEYMIEDASQISLAENKIITFAEILGLSNAKGKGKLTVYLERFKKGEYIKLVDAGIIRR